MKQFNVIFYDFNKNKMIPYDVMPYLVDCYEKAKKGKKPTTREEFRKFIDRESAYMYWARCEYEIILSDWPNQSTEEKWDIYRQIMMNIDIITDLLMESVCKETSSKKNS